LVRDTDGSRLLLRERTDEKEESEELMDEWEEQGMGGKWKWRSRRWEWIGRMEL
jgi:hypothetical protein